MEGILNPVWSAWGPKCAQAMESKGTLGRWDSVNMRRHMRAFKPNRNPNPNPNPNPYLNLPPDDPSWLPLGPSNRERDGVKRYQPGYLAYAGAGKNSRGTQLIVAFNENAYLGGGSPWEVGIERILS